MFEHPPPEARRRTLRLYHESLLKRRHLWEAQSVPICFVRDGAGWLEYRACKQCRGWVQFRAVNLLLVEDCLDQPEGTAYLSRLRIPPDLTLDELRDAAILQAVRRADGVRQTAARSLGLAVKTVSSVLRRYGIPGGKGQSAAKKVDHTKLIAI